ncbi:DUF6767 domain-containing protein [Dermatophilus congolensis]|uniref:DUF6767 domain-containing protein n=1 Tax=Dermatophilus congolensis TaxID=1863 RepID=UPI001D34303C|nr:DUF6767 domain-containing protein [Dermatophilus congolensis]MBO3141959.1 hypothetical protein [Dermatophilus congolensis]MBO3150951.1 hypothetical protein [Dermatophilus congolensis]MBO3162044.1 hypothetical protein [Dermatophilus congolensis]MBO3162234.1 hypothetical protein [Dermatophilus congolensis]MBO3175790.1 hypothetical protein [Dermatophilus congolensis]
MQMSKGPRGEDQCVVRVGEPCRLCQPGASGPKDCQLAYLVLNDPELRDLLEEKLTRLEEAA